MSNGPDLHDHGYEIVERLGYGTTSTVYLAKQNRVADRLVVVKALKDRDFTSKVFERERHVAAAFSHDHVLSFIDTIEDDNGSYLIVEYAPAGVRTGPLPRSVVIEAGIDLADALARAHAANIVHSDIKPENIFWLDETTAKVGDFGIARLLDQTSLGDYLGASYAWAPNSIRTEGTDAASDVWSLAATLGSFLTGTEPPDLNFDSIDAPLRSVLDRAMAADASSMTMSAADLRDALTALREHPKAATVIEGDLQPEASLATGAPPGTPGSLPARTSAPARGRGRVALGIGALVLAGGIGAGVLLASNGPNDDDPTLESVAADGDEGAGDQSDGSEQTDTTASESATTTAGSSAAIEVLPVTELTQAAFASDQGGAFSLFMLTGSSVQALPVSEIAATSPSMSPDASRVVFEQAGSVRSVVVADADGSNSQVLSQAEADATSPAWSPDGSSIAWVARGDSSQDLWLYDVASGAASVIGSSSANESSPAWSPDGQRIVFRSDRSGNGDIYALDMASGVVTQLTDTSDVEDHPAVSESGLLAFERRIDGDAEVFEMNGEEIIRITTRDGFDGYPAYAGDTIYYLSSDGSASWIADAAGTRYAESAGVMRDLEIAPIRD